MYKQISYINNDGESVHSYAVSFTGRFHEKNGYSLYAYGKTINTRTTVSFPEGMNKNDIANMLLLSKHLMPNVNVLGYRTNKGNVPMKVKQIGDVIDTQDRQTRRFITKMTQLHLLKRKIVPVVVGEEVHKEVHYIINPLYFLNGKTISDSLYWTFNEELGEHLPQWVHDEYTKRANERV